MRAALALCAALAALSAAAPARHPIVHHVRLERGGLPESWSVTVPGTPWPNGVAQVDLVLDHTARAGYEFLGASWPIPPWGYVHSVENAVVSVSGVEVHRELLALKAATDQVAQTFDGVDDFAGLSGTTCSGSSESIGDTSLTDATLFAAPTVQLEVSVGSSGTGFVSYGHPWHDSIEVTVEGFLTVYYWP